MDAKRNQDREPCRLRLLGHKLQMQCVLRTDKWVYVVSQLINAPFFLTLYSKTFLKSNLLDTGILVTWGHRRQQ